MASENQDVYVVTGGAGGMGFASAQRLGKLGRVLLTDVVSGPLEKAAAQLSSEGIRVSAHVTDISSKASVYALADTAASLGRLAGIAHTAGVSPVMADWKRVLEVDLIGTAILLNAFLPLAVPRTAVVCWASISGHMVDKDPALDAVLSDPLSPDFFDRIKSYMGPEETASISAYMFAKRGVILLCEKLAPVWGEHGARIVSLSPGIIDTAMGRMELDKQPAMRKMIEMSPIKRMGTPEELVDAAEFLLSDKVSFITGTDLRVDGGVMAVFAPPTKTK